MLDVDPSLATALVDFPGPAGTRQRLAFERPRQWLVAHDPSQVPALLDAAHQAARDGAWCVGWVAYEAAPGLDAHLPVKALPPDTPYAVWAVFDKARTWPEDGGLRAPGGRWCVGPWQAATSEPRVRTQIEQIRELIRAGEVYQINLTTRLEATFEAVSIEDTGPDPTVSHPSEALHGYFRALLRAQPDGYGLMLDGRAAARQPGAVLSVSPELFFDWDGEQLTTRPMKGTAPRAADPAQDQRAADHLRTSAKERAENLMIVDLLRNDLSRVAQVGSVAVPALFDVQALPTVWQMTSTITARTRAGLRLSELFTALFPCGSVTGAPKRQAMHHIARMEAGPRGVYCGAAGLMAPGGRVTVNVPIRTVVVHTPPPPAPWTLRCGIGSGITLDATPEGEASEWIAKQAFLRRADQPFQLLESLRLQDGQIPRLDLHLARLARGARHFAYRWDDGVEASCRQALRALARRHPGGVFKLRLLLDADGLPRAEAAPLTAPSTGPLPVVLAHQPLPRADRDEFIRHKTTQRAAYAPFAPPAGVFDTLLHNERGELTEFTIGNLALKLDGQWFTPPLSSGLLPGVMRESLLAEGRLLERPLTLGDLARADGLALVNSVRGWVDVALRPSGSTAA